MAKFPASDEASTAKGNALKKIDPAALEAAKPEIPPEALEDETSLQSWLEAQVRAEFRQAEMEPLPHHLVALARQFRARER